MAKNNRYFYVFTKPKIKTKQNISGVNHIKKKISKIMPK